MYRCVEGSFVLLFVEVIIIIVVVFMMLVDTTKSAPDAIPVIT